MDKLLNNEKYLQDIEYVALNNLIDWNQLKDKKILVSGSTGMIGKFFVDVIMNKNIKEGMNCTIIALGRNPKKAESRFKEYLSNEKFIFKKQDINEKFDLNIEKIDYIIHGASNTHPLQYSSDPIGTITSNVIGTYNLLDLASKHDVDKFLFMSSVEIYGENRGDTEKFSEEYCGYIDCNTLRAGYPESKRTGEALCQAFCEQKNLNCVIARLPRIFGPTMQMDDSKAIAQFLKNAINSQDIILKSEGNQYYSFGYVADVVLALLCLITKGENKNAYNIAADDFNITLKELAEKIAKISGNEVIFNIPNIEESKGYSKATKAILSSEKINNLGWNIKYGIDKRLEETIEILKKIT